ncbi:MAG: AMP-binding protein [Pirellulales bacterium]
MNRLATEKPMAPAAEVGQIVNVAARLAAMAKTRPDSLAVVAPRGRGYESITFKELDQYSDRAARGLRKLGVVPGTRMALLVKPGIEFVALVFALFKAGAVAILIDPGMGRRSLVDCLDEARPEGFVAIPMAHLVRKLLRSRFREARIHVVVARHWLGREPTLTSLVRRPWSGGELAATRAGDPAAIIFTSGSTGPPKGVLYSHGNFDRQVDEIRDYYQIAPGEVDLACFPLFGLFNCAMGVTTVIPDMDASRPARVDPARIVSAVRDWKVTQSFGSPAVWDRVGQHCAKHDVRMPSLGRVMSAGAPVTARVLAGIKGCIAPGGEVHTPYGATEALPVASISASEVLNKTAALTARGAGVCVGRRFPGIEWKVIEAVEGPLAADGTRSVPATVADGTSGRAARLSSPKSGMPATLGVRELPAGSIGELIVRGPVVTNRYVTRVEANALAKIGDGPEFWHRMGDVGYLDEQGRFWYCGRLSQRVLSAAGPMYTECCEAIFNNHPAVFRSALVGIGPLGSQRPVMICEPWPGKFPRRAARRQLLDELRSIGSDNPLTSSIDDYLLHRSFPVDVRHNAKIFREKLARWAARQLS